MPELQTARLRLAPLDDEHFEGVKALFGDSGVRAIYGEGRDSDEAVADWISWSREQPAKGVPGFWALTTAQDGFVGLCGLLLQTVDGVTDVEVGYLLRDRFRGRGYATEAARFARDYAFRELAAPRVISIILTTNEPSIRVALRNGMRLDRQTIWRDRRVGIYAVEPPAPP